MSLGKQAKILANGHGEAFWVFCKEPIPNQKPSHLSVVPMAGLKAKEIALLTWEMITDADRQVGQAIHLQDKASEGRSGRIINLNGELRSAPGFKGSPGVQGRQIHMVSSERSAKVSPQTVVNIFSSWHELFGFDECSSHS